MPAWAATIDAARGSTKAGALFEARGRCGSFLAWLVNNRASDRAHRAGHQAGFSRTRVLPGAPGRSKRPELRVLQAFPPAGCQRNDDQHAGPDCARFVPAAEIARSARDVFLL